MQHHNFLPFIFLSFFGHSGFQFVEPVRNSFSTCIMLTKGFDQYVSQFLDRLIRYNMPGINIINRYFFTIQNFPISILRLIAYYHQIRFQSNN